MIKDAHGNNPTKGIWLRFLVLIPIVIAMIIISQAYIRSKCATYDAWTPVYMEGNYSDLSLEDVKCEHAGVVEPVSVQRGANGAACVTFKALSDGETMVSFGNAQKGPKDEVWWDFRVTQGAIIEGGVNFSGWESVHICVCVFIAICAVLFASVVVRLWRASWYGYEMVAGGGGFVFFAFQSAFFILLYLRGSYLEFADIAYDITNMVSWFVYLTFLPMGILAVLVSISNIWLIRHEGMRPVNLLGIAVSVVYAIVIFLWFHWWYMGADLPLSFEILQVVDSVLAVGITFGECLLLSTIACAWLASLHVPRHGMDYLVVLGCGIRSDGTPSPLLAGRVDRALAFDQERIGAGDESATFVPSGGQGPDEVMSEAQSMKDYLLKKGVDSNRVVMEGKSSTTQENMAFSRKVIEDHAGMNADELSIAFSTTNYHVFRGYVCAHQAGMVVEGMASKTKAYFWPNAFLREFAGLLVTQWKGILQTFLIIAVVYAFAEYILILS